MENLERKIIPNKESKFHRIAKKVKYESAPYFILSMPVLVGLIPLALTYIFPPSENPIQVDRSLPSVMKFYDANNNNVLEPNEAKDIVRDYNLEKR